MLKILFFVVLFSSCSNASRVYYIEDNFASYDKYIRQKEIHKILSDLEKNRKKTTEKKESKSTRSPKTATSSKIQKEDNHTSKKKKIFRDSHHNFNDPYKQYGEKLTKNIKQIINPEKDNEKTVNNQKFLTILGFENKNPNLGKHPKTHKIMFSKD